MVIEEIPGIALWIVGALLAAPIERSSIVLGNDTMPAGMGAASSAPTTIPRMPG
jgi:hypothetical protein